jgi:phytoene dehydrogenase-like protein
MAAAVTLAAAGLSVKVIEGAATPGGGCRTEELTLPGYRHDVCSAVHPLLAASPFFTEPTWAALRDRLRQPEVAFAHPLDGGRAVAVERSLTATADGLGRDGRAYRALVGRFAARADRLVPDVLSPPLRVAPRTPAAAAFAAAGLAPASVLGRRFATEEARALLAGAAAHSMRPLSSPLTGAFGMLLTVLAHAAGWPLVEGGSGAITAALAAELTRRGGTVETDHWVRDLAELDRPTVALFDVAPAALAAIAGDRVAARTARALRRFRHGPGVCKVDWALSGPVPWAAEAARRAGTLHLGGTMAEVAASEAEAWAGRHPERPFCLVAQPGVVDPTRAPPGRHTLWAYCHVPSGSDVDMSSAIEAQIERFAPGFGDLVEARAVRTALDVAAHDPNDVGGDIGGGVADLHQTLFRPLVRWNPYRVARDLYLCSSSTPPGGGVHGMCGVWAARTALHDHFGGPPPFRR